MVALQLEMEDGRAGGREGGRKRSRTEEVRQEEARQEEARQRGRQRKRKEEANQGGGRNRGSALRTELKSRGCNSSDLKTILYYYRSIGKAVFDKAGGQQHNITEAAPNELKLGEDR